MNFRTDDNYIIKYYVIFKMRVLSISFLTIYLEKNRKKGGGSLLHEKTHFYLFIQKINVLNGIPELAISKNRYCHFSFLNRNKNKMK